ncbi:MAG: ATP-binding cassette domain-containing protein [Bacteroidetes bacterium]|nr:ATP-binding cassette domain-containing protein [Bacteroidota bacterium]
MNSIPSLPIIEARNLTVRFGERTIFENVSFTIHRGDILVILGGSGCGKSTLLRTLTGLNQPTEGQVLIDGEDFTAAVGAERTRLLRKFGILFQSGGLFASMSLAENIALPLQTYTNLSENDIETMITLKLGSVGLDGFQEFLPSEISGGMKKRAGLARAMALDPEILFFDEPSAGLDPISSVSLDNLILNLNSALGTTMIVVTHELDSINKIAKRALMLDRDAQGIIAFGTLDEVKNNISNPRINHFFNRIAEE